SAIPNRGFAAMDGTSMATPHIAGLAALLFSASKGATVDQIEDAIFKSCRLLPGMTNDRAGRGAPNGPRALEILTGQTIAAAATSIAVAGGRPSPKAGRARGRKGPRRAA